MCQGLNNGILVSIMPAVRNFSLCAGAAVFFNLLLQLSVFVAVMENASPECYKASSTARRNSLGRWDGAGVPPIFEICYI